VLGRPGDDAGVFRRTVRLCIAGRVTFPRLLAHEGPDGMSAPELERGLAWARRALHTHRAIWRRAALSQRGGGAALVANYRARRAVLTEPRCEATPAMRLAHALARPIRIRERVPFVSTIVGAVQARSGQVRTAWLRTRAMRDETVAALVIRLEGAIDASAARTLVARVCRAVGRTSERIVIDLGGLESVSLTVLTRFLEEHASRLDELRGRLAFRNLRPALAALRENLHGMVPNAALLEQALEETA
jgi:anti-anti-sigma regulatory factor